MMAKFVKRRRTRFKRRFRKRRVYKRIPRKNIWDGAICRKVRDLSTIEYFKDATYEGVFWFCGLSYFGGVIRANPYTQRHSDLRN